MGAAPLTAERLVDLEAIKALKEEVAAVELELKTSTDTMEDEARGLRMQLQQLEGKLSSAIASTETKDAQLTEHLRKIESLMEKKIFLV